MNDPSAAPWAETFAILSDRSFVREVERGLAEIDNGERLYTFEEVFGEPLPPEDA